MDPVKTSASPNLDNADERYDRRRKLTQNDIERMRIPKMFWKARFDKIYDGDHKRVIERYMRRLPKAKKNGYGLILWGDNDGGKTSAAVVIVKAARRLRYTCFFITAAQYREQVMSGQMFDENASVRSWCSAVDFLVFDDFQKEPGSDKSSGGSERMIEDLIRDRTSNKKATIITMNSDPRQMEKRYGWSLKSLIAERFAIVRVNAPSMRSEGVQEIKEFLS